MIRCLGRQKWLSKALVRSCGAAVIETESNQTKISMEQTKGTKIKDESKPSERYLKFKEKLRSSAPVIAVPKGMPHPAHEKEPLMPWPNNTNPYTGEIGGPRGPEPTRYGDWESKGRVTDF
ncbi:succinate dehydrogenase assembly factor 4, mitochondrial [Drosophila novamexicana]|uniref:succinate dehydrogenase assembly factor 4, mitochondrial n=1 Tax=Drosophila novamexicana TaxID=47314 RepID=UPI0011E5ADC7|nr:succinate dehydrogenase assembly factor 4, mitochondrial [Drosophila novamexicana]